MTGTRMPRRQFLSNGAKLAAAAAAAPLVAAGSASAARTHDHDHTRLGLVGMITSG